MNIKVHHMAMSSPSSKGFRQKLFPSSKNFHKTCKLASADIQFGGPRDSVGVERAMTQEEKCVYSAFGKSALATATRKQKLLFARKSTCLTNKTSAAYYYY